MNAATDLASIRLHNSAGLTLDLTSHGAIRRLRCEAFLVNLFVASETEGGPANLWLRRRAGDHWDATPLLGPSSSTSCKPVSNTQLVGCGAWGALQYTLMLTLAEDALSWAWRVRVENRGPACDIDVIYAQDLALAPYGAVRINEYYVSQYVDHTPLAHPERGWVIASRQNQPVSGRHPWSIIGSLRRARSFATDALQVYGVEQRAGRVCVRDLPGVRLQHEHSMAALQDEVQRVSAGRPAEFGFVGSLQLDHPAATSMEDLAVFDCVLAFALDAAQMDEQAAAPAPARSLFATAPLLEAEELDEATLEQLFPGERRHAERDGSGRLLSFFHDEDRHVVLQAKELCVQRPHGAMLRTGAALTPDEASLTSTVWMSGVFHSMLTQGHVSINRILSTARSYLGLFRAHGQRVFIELDNGWRLLGAPSAFEMRRGAARWLYRVGGKLIEVRAGASASHALALAIEVLEGADTRFLIANHVALNGDDGAAPGVVVWRQAGDQILLSPAEGSEMHARFPNGSFVIEMASGSLTRIGGDELLYSDGRSRTEPYLCLETARTRAIGMRMRADFTSDAPVPSITAPQEAFHIEMHASQNSALREAVAQLGDIAPWFIDNALVHYLAPRGLEQYTGGGWGTRDVSQGPVELLLSFGGAPVVRDLLLRVMRAQNPDGDWPQWFMFFDRDRHIRAGDSHGDVVFWPVLALAQYLLASGDASVLTAQTPFGADDTTPAASVWEHVQRALALTEKRVVRGTSLAAYGHGDWNDSLQPADPAMREHMCSAWTVTLHYQTLTTLARALRAIGRPADAEPLEVRARKIAADFQRLLIVDDVLAGYALFEVDTVRYLLHPRDAMSGVRYSALAMIHAILEGMFTPAQARAHLKLLERELSGPDGVRLFDRPMPYHGGLQRFFQRAETAAFFGREIGLMYMHAHLRYAQALAHVGEADKFFHALRQANPIGLRALTPQASVRQVNCYYSSSDGAFTDRYEACRDYERLRRGEIRLDGGWRVYSSGAGIAMSLIVRRFLGVAREHDAVIIDPVIPPALDGLHARLMLEGRPLKLQYEVRGPGCGVSALALNGRELSFERMPNPYRLGAARVAKSSVTSLFQNGDNILHVTLG